MTTKDFAFRAGSLVNVRNRDWVVQPSPDPDLLLLKPLGATEDELTGIYLPLEFDEDKPHSTEFGKPTPDDIGDISSARLLYNATRLAFRNGAGPFRSIAKLSFRPRSYQMVPLIMALRLHGPVRLLIADDVGVGKTIESLIILKELLERREIRRFAVIVLPHLCEQWQNELKDKFGIDAVIIRSNTQARLDREIQGDTSVYEYYPYQVISIDYIKSPTRRQVFLQKCPEFVIVDEAHTCSKPGGTKNTNQQQRFALIRDLSQKPEQSIVMLTATPHSGKPEEFSSLLSLLDSAYETIDLPTATPEQRNALAKSYVQRRRADIVRWLGEDTPFPKRDSGEFAYELKPDYLTFYHDAVQFALGLAQSTNTNKPQQRMRYWSALALLRGIMSSPAAGAAMLANRLAGHTVTETELTDDIENPIIDDEFDSEKDYSSSLIIQKVDWSSAEVKRLKSLSDRLQQLSGIQHDAKVADAISIIGQWLKKRLHPVIFCRYIATAHYVGELLKKELPKQFKDINVQVVTSEEPDDARKARIVGMEKSNRRVLVATDCISEGINLQDGFSAVLHYDLPWNPNRLEQREGRIDRFGQTAPEVKTYLLYGKNNPIDGVVLNVLLRKVREIRRSIGISLPFPENSRSLMDSVLQAVLLKQKDAAIQTSLDFGEFEETKNTEKIVTHAIDQAAEREQLSRSIFAQHSIRAEEIEQDLREVDEAIGEPSDVEEFVVESLNTLLGVQISRDKKGYILVTANVPANLKQLLPPENHLKVTFHSPAPEGYLYLGRNHLFVEQLCQHLTAKAMTGDDGRGPSRAAVIKTTDVAEKTTILLFRVRSVIAEKSTRQQLVAEEMLVWGYGGMIQAGKRLPHDSAIDLLRSAAPSANLTDESRRTFLEQELRDIETVYSSGELDTVANTRAEVLVEAHERFRKTLGGSRYTVVKPVLPMDLLGVYILLPDRSYGK